jgi:hypothetical protein
MKNGRRARISKLVDFYDFLIFDVFELSGSYPASQISRQPLLIQLTVGTPIVPPTGYKKDRPSPGRSRTASVFQPDVTRQ